MHKEWRVSNEFATKSRFKKFADKYPRELNSCAANLDKLIGHLNSGLRLSVLAQNLSFLEQKVMGCFGSDKVE